MSSGFKVISPIDNSVLLEREYASTSTVSTAIYNAKKVFKNWKNTPISSRRLIIQKAIDFLLSKADDIGKEITLQMGRPIRYSPFEIKGGLKERAEYMLSIGEDSLQNIETKARDGFQRYVKKEPLGLVLVLAPWNYPFLTSINVIVPALLAGNCVILKHSDQTPLTSERYLEAFREAGLPEGVFQFLHIDHEQVGHLVKSKDIDYVAFTGSVTGGHAIQKAANHRFINTGLELGGKDPAYICNDADLSFAIENTVDGAFFNSGQSCCGIERIYVHENIYDDFLDGFVHLTKQYILGNPLEATTTIGPMVRSTSKNFVQNHIDLAIREGAKALLPNSNNSLVSEASAYLFPQVLINVNHEMEVMKEETFGPIVGIMPVKSDEEAIRLMNDSKYGLTASIWSSDTERAIRIGDQIETGTVFLNRCDYLDPELAWTGVKNSGKGATLSKLGYDALTRPKSFHLRLPK